MTRSRIPLSSSDAVLLLAAVAVLITVAAAAVTARTGSIDDRARAIELQLRCPTCQGLSIADSPAGSASQMRALVREQLVSGATDDEVRGFFVARYGRWILLDPPAGGPDLVLWLAPAAIVALGAWLVVRRARRQEPAPPSRRWHASPPLPAPRLGTVLVTGAMVLALVVPVAAAVGPRLAGREVSGGTTQGNAPTIEELEAFVRAEPRDVDALVALGDALLGADRAGDAAERYRAALEIDPNNVEALLGVGAILLAADRPDGAGPVFDRILSITPDQPDALLFRAVAHRRMEGTLTPDARRDVERFLAVASADDPRREMANALLADDARPTPSHSSAPGRSSPP